MLSRSVKIILTLPDLNVETPDAGLRPAPAAMPPGNNGRGEAVPRPWRPSPRVIRNPGSVSPGRARHRLAPTTPSGTLFIEGRGWRGAQRCGLRSFWLHATQGLALRQPAVRISSAIIIPPVLHYTATPNPKAGGHWKACPRYLLQYWNFAVNPPNLKHNDQSLAASEVHRL